MSGDHSVLVKVQVHELIHLDSEGFDELVDDAAGGVLSGYTVEVEDVEDNTLLVLRVTGDLLADTEPRMSEDKQHEQLQVEWQAAFDALRAAGLEADADDPIAARYRAASDAVNHSNRKRDFGIATRRSR